MPIVERRGQPALHYVIDDYTDPWKNAPAIVLQHGFARSAKFWYQWVPYLARFYKVIRTDLRGLGESSRDFDLQNGFTAANWIGDLDAILDEGVFQRSAIDATVGPDLDVVADAHRTQLLNLDPLPLMRRETESIGADGDPRVQNASVPQHAVLTDRDMRLQPAVGADFGPAFDHTKGADPSRGIDLCCGMHVSRGMAQWVALRPLHLPPKLGQARKIQVGIVHFDARLERRIEARQPLTRVVEVLVRIIQRAAVMRAHDEEAHHLGIVAL